MVLVTDLAVACDDALLLGMGALAAVWEDVGISVHGFGGPFTPMPVGGTWHRCKCGASNAEAELGT